MHDLRKKKRSLKKKRTCPIRELRKHRSQISNPKNMSFPGGSVVKNSPDNAGAAGDTSSIPGSGRPHGRENGN